MRKKILLGLGGLLVALVALWFFVLRDDAPPPPSAASAAAVAAASQSTTAAPSTTAQSTTVAPTTTLATTTTEAPAGVSGIWEADLTIGSFDDFSSSFVGFRVNEELGLGIGHTTAVGRTPEVAGEFIFDDSSLLSATVTAELGAIVTDQTRRDDAVYEALDVITYPEALFVLQGPLLFEAGAEGEQTLATTGTLTIKGVTNEVQIELVAQLVGEVIAVTGQFPVVFADYGVEVPSAPIVISVEDEGIVEIQLFLRRPAG